MTRYVDMSVAALFLHMTSCESIVVRRGSPTSARVRPPFQRRQYCTLNEETRLRGQQHICMNTLNIPSNDLLTATESDR